MNAPLTEAELDRQARQNVDEQKRLEYEQAVQAEKERLRACERYAYVGSKLTEHSVRQREERERV